MKNKSLQFCSETIHPGESLTLALPLPKIFSCAPFYMPIKIIHGKQPGPTLLLIGAMYGNEMNGTEIIHRLLNLPALSRMKGTLIAVPVMNVHGLINRSRFLPDGTDMNRHFPGCLNGTNSERLTNIFVTEILSRADYCINLQTGPLNHYNLPMVQFYGNDEASLQLAQIFNTPIIMNETAEPGSLQHVALEQNKYMLNYIAGEAMRFDAQAARIGMHGIVNIMRHLQMLPPKKNPSNNKPPKLADSVCWISACASGTHRVKGKLGQTVKKDELLSVIKDPFGGGDIIPVHSPENGMIVVKNHTPFIYEGDRLFQLAVFSEAMEVPAEISSPALDEAI